MVFSKTLKNFDLENFRSESFSIPTSCIESSRFRAHVAKGRPAFRDRSSTAAIVQLSSTSLIKQYVKTANQYCTDEMEVCTDIPIIM